MLIPEEEKTTEVEAQKLRKLIERCNIVFTERKRSESMKISVDYKNLHVLKKPPLLLIASFAVKNVDQDLNGLLKGNLDVTNLRMFLLCPRDCRSDLTS